MASEVEIKVEKQFADKTAIYATKKDLTKAISSLEVSLTQKIFIAGIVQFLAIVGSFSQL
jgi:hypothetical protein